MPNPPYSYRRPPHYAERPTEVLQARQAALLLAARALTDMEEEELQAIGYELKERQVLSIGIDFSAKK